MIVAQEGFPANDLKELIAWLKANPGKATVGTVGVGGTGRSRRLSFPEADRHQRSSSCRIAAARRAAGPGRRPDRPAHSGQAANYLGQVRGRPDQALRDARRRSAGGRRPRCRPSTRPACRASTASLWHGLWAPKGTPKDIIAKLNAAVVEALADPAVTRSGSPTSARTSGRASSRRRRRCARTRRPRSTVVADHQGRQHQGAVTTCSQERRQR